MKGTGDDATPPKLSENAVNEGEILAEAEKIAASWRLRQNAESHCSVRTIVSWVVVAACTVFLIARAIAPQFVERALDSRLTSAGALTCLLFLAAYGIYYRALNPKISIEERKFLAVAKGDWRTFETLNNLKKRRTFDQTYALPIRLYFYVVAIVGAFCLIGAATLYLLGM